MPPQTRRQVQQQRAGLTEIPKDAALLNSRQGQTVYDFPKNKTHGLPLTLETIDKDIESKPCFYTLYVPCGEIVKIGKAVNAHARLKSYIVRYNEHVLLLYLKYFNKRSTGMYGHEKVEGEYYNGIFENEVKRLAKKFVDQRHFIDPNQTSPEFFEADALPSLKKAIRAAEDEVRKLPEHETRNMTRTRKPRLRMEDEYDPRLGGLATKEARALMEEKKILAKNNGKKK